MRKKGKYVKQKKLPKFGKLSIAEYQFIFETSGLDFFLQESY